MSFHAVRVLLILLALAELCYSDIIFNDFNETTGLIFVRDAGTTACKNDTLLAYGDVAGKADQFNENVVDERSETTDFISESIVETNLATFNEEIQTSLAGFLHRNDTISAPGDCRVRIRLTPSGPSKVGAVWFREKSPVSSGFDTYFTFQISDHSKECTLVKDQYFSKLHHRSCSVRGADGFAFVIQNSNTSISGQDGGQMGFGNIENSLAIAFDTWTNPGQDTMLTDHVSIQSRGRSANDGLESGLLGLPRPHKLADGKIHRVRISYYGKLIPQYFDQLVASESLIPFLLDNGEQKRIGTLVVFLDEGIDKDIPLIALPINLSLLLHMPDDKAYVGFTSSTGRFYEKHDILSWTYCDHPPCAISAKEGFDYHTTGKTNQGKYQRYVPGAGYGGDDTGQSFPLKNTSPDTTAISEPLQQFAPDRNDGLAANADIQVPPNTLY